MVELFTRLFMMTTWVKDHPHPSVKTLLPVCCPVIPGKSADLVDMPAPLQIVKQQHSLRPIVGKHKRNVGDCIVCSDRKKKSCRSMHECKQCRKPMSMYPCFERYHTLIDLKVSCTGKDMHSGPASSSYDDPDLSLPSSSRSSSPSSESSASPPALTSRRSAGGIKRKK